MGPSPEKGQQSVAPKETPQAIRRKERLEALDGVREMLTDPEEIANWFRYMTRFVLESEPALQAYERINPSNPYLYNDGHYGKLEHTWEIGIKELKKIARRTKISGPKTQTQTQTQRKGS